jgi:hypothetical protein
MFTRSLYQYWFCKKYFTYEYQNDAFLMFLFIFEEGMENVHIIVYHLRFAFYADKLSFSSRYGLYEQPVILHVFISVALQCDIIRFILLYVFLFFCKHILYLLS